MSFFIQRPMSLAVNPFAAAFLAILIPTGLSAQEQDPCKVTNGGAMAGAMCVSKKIEVADRELNRTYQAALKRIRAEEAFEQAHVSGVEYEEPFRAAQRAWLKFKDAECEFRGGITTSSPWQTVQIEQCKLEMILERIEYFKTVFVG
ncbi:lysozyme inhibitor LprI family protein [Marinobacter mangrovi]|uniref:lysozyme inhibitor LprI family protein n=1 Tax=Marinobacter mangrovi TaxID=2803918 RepID=UPI0019332FB8|nr:lysozyme inhibitor LprI family protein [Marinobacter mangrovi]